MRRASARYRFRRPDLPGAVVICLEKLLVFVHKRGIASSGDLARPESLKMMKHHRINKFIDRVNIGTVAAFPACRGRLSFSRCLSLALREAFVPIHAEIGASVSVFHE